MYTVYSRLLPHIGYLAPSESIRSLLRTRLECVLSDSWTVVYADEYVLSDRGTVVNADEYLLSDRRTVVNADEYVYIFK